MRHDYVIFYAEKNGMVLITEDKESFGGCMENQIPCVQLGQNPTNDEITRGLEKFKNLPRKPSSDILPVVSKII